MKSIVGCHLVKDTLIGAVKDIYNVKSHDFQ